MSVDAGLSFEAQLGELREQVNPLITAYQAAQERSAQMQRGIHAVNLTSVQFPVVSGALTIPTATVLLGPEDGQVWDVRRVTLAGWSTADAAINVNMWRELSINQPTAQGNPQNRLAKFNDSAPGNERWAPGGGLILHSPDAVLITGSGFTTTTGIWVTLEGVALEQKLEPYYLL